MSKIFGISDLPVSTISSALEPNAGIKVPAPIERVAIKNAYVALEKTPKHDQFISKVHEAKVGKNLGKLFKNMRKNIRG